MGEHNHSLIGKGSACDYDPRDSLFLVARLTCVRIKNYIPPGFAIGGITLLIGDFLPNSYLRVNLCIERRPEWTMHVDPIDRLPVPAFANLNEMVWTPDNDATWVNLDGRASESFQMPSSCVALLSY